MPRIAAFLALVFLFNVPASLVAQEDERPPISITSPDNGVTFAYATIKSHSLVWNKNLNMLQAVVTFTDGQMNQGQPNDDTHEFRFPGVTFDQAKGVFYATTRDGVVIPIAHIKKALFFNSIVPYPNARVRIIYPRGNITVILEAIPPTDPAMHPAPTDPDGTHAVDIKSTLQ